MHETSPAEVVIASPTYETLRQRHIADGFARLPDYVQRVRWPVERLKEERRERLRSLIRLAKEKSSWHRQRLLDIDAETITEEELRKLPVMTKADLMANFNEIATDNRLTLSVVNDHVSRLTKDEYLLDKYHVIASGGTSGFRGVFVYDWDEWIVCLMSARHVLVRMAQLVAATGKPPVERGAAIFADIASHMSYALSHTFDRGQTRWLPATLPLHEIVDGLNAYQPDTLSGYPSMVYRLALEAKAGRLHIKPNWIWAGGEPLPPYVQNAVRTAWNIPVVNAWVTSEGGFVGWSCGKGKGMHLNEDLCIVEPVDENGLPVKSGVRASKIYLTNLFNRTTPLIRYEISDQVSYLDEGPCACGCSFRRVDDIEGRLDDVFTYKGGVIVHPVAFWSAFEHHPAVVEYQVRQTPHGATALMVADGPVVVDRVEQDIRENLKSAGLRNPQVSAKLVDRLERTPGVAKLKRFVPLQDTQREVTSTTPVVA